MAAVIEVEGLRKEYRRFRKPRTVALDGLELRSPRAVCSGSSVPTERVRRPRSGVCWVLVAASAGRARVLGGDVPHSLPGVIRKVGRSWKRRPRYPRFTGRRNLEILARIDGIDRGAVDAALDRVGLSSRAGDMVRTYSLGMKQRPGIAAALLKDPP